MLSIPALPSVCILFISRFLTLQIEFLVFRPLIYSCTTCFVCFSNCLLFHSIGFCPPCSRFVLHASFLYLPMYGHTFVFCYFCVQNIFSCLLNYARPHKLHSFHYHRAKIKTVCLTFYCLALCFFICFSWHLIVCDNFCCLCYFPAAPISFLASIIATAVAVKILHSAQG